MDNICSDKDNVNKCFFSLLNNCLTKSDSKYFSYFPFQEASNPPIGGHQLKPAEPLKKPSWISRCTLL